MKLRRRKKDVPGLNTTSTADISFMLLVFFLVTTSMYVDKGFIRQLPPKDKEKQEQKEVHVEKENIMAIKLDETGQLFVNDSVCQQKDLKKLMQEFIASRGKEHLITIDADPACQYESYFSVQNSLVGAYSSVREGIANKLYGRSMSKLTAIDREAVLEKCPQRIAENYHEEDSE